MTFCQSYDNIQIMRTEILYYVDGISWPFRTQKEALEAEAKHKEDCARWMENLHSPHTKMEKLIKDLENALHIPEGTIATCTFSALQIKGLVRVCQKFVEEHKEYLNYY